MKLELRLAPEMDIQSRCKILYIEPGSPWENGYIERFNGKL